MFWIFVAQGKWTGDFFVGLEKDNRFPYFEQVFFLNYIR